MNKGKVIPGEDNMQDWRRIEPVLTDYAQKRGLEIHVDNPHGHKADPETYSPSTLWIRFWSFPSGLAKSTKMRKACGHKLDMSCTGDAFEPTGLGTPITDHDGVILAEVVGKNNIYVLFDLPHDFRYSDEVMKFILDEYDRSKNTIASIREFALTILSSLKRRQFSTNNPQKRKYFETFLDSNTELYYRDEKEIARRWRDLVRSAHERRVYVIKNKIFVPLGRKIIKHKPKTYVIISLNIGVSEVRGIYTRQPFSEKKVLEGKYEYEEKLYCLGNIRESIKDFLDPRVREDALAVLAMKEFFRQGNY